MSSADNAQFNMLPIDVLFVSPHNVRKSAEDAKVEETNIETLTMNIKQYGLLNPLTVCASLTAPDRYEILAGQRRFAALTQLGWTTVPCRIVKCDNAEQAELLSLAENIQRLPMTIKDKCQTIFKLYKLHQDNIDEVVKFTNLAPPTVKRYLNLSQNLASSLHDQFDEKGDGKLTLGIAQMLAGAVEGEDEQKRVFDAIKDLGSTKQKKDVLKALAENPDADVDDVVNQVRQKDTSRKNYSKIKREPWVYDQEHQPCSIPKLYHSRVYDLIASAEQDLAAPSSSSSHKRKRRAG